MMINLTLPGYRIVRVESSTEMQVYLEVLQAPEAPALAGHPAGPAQLGAVAPGDVRAS